MTNSSVICDMDVFLTIKEPTRTKYEKYWKLFKVFSIKVSFSILILITLFVYKNNCIVSLVDILMNKTKR